MVMTVQFQHVSEKMSLEASFQFARTHFSGWTFELQKKCIQALIMQNFSCDNIKNHCLIKLFQSWDSLMTNGVFESKSLQFHEFKKSLEELMIEKGHAETRDPIYMARCKL